MSLLRVPKTKKYSMSLEDDKVRVGVTAMQGWRPEMEDAHLVELELPFAPLNMSSGGFGGKKGTGSSRDMGPMPVRLHPEDGALFGIFDGHCGGKLAQVAAQSMLQWVTSGEDFKRQQFQQALSKGFVKGDKQMQEEHPMVQAGCTANVIMMAGTKLLCANAGDTRSILSKGGAVIPLSEDHKPNNTGELQRITRAGGFVSPQGRVYGILALSRALGDYMFKSNKELAPDEQVVSAVPDVFEHEVTIEDEFIVMACDGIWDVMSSQEVATFVRSELNDHGDVTMAAERLVDTCLAPNYMGKGTDNMSVIVVQFKSDFLRSTEELFTPTGSGQNFGADYA